MNKVTAVIFAKDLTDIASFLEDIWEVVMRRISAIISCLPVFNYG